MFSSASCCSSGILAPFGNAAAQSAYADRFTVIVASDDNQVLTDSAPETMLGIISRMMDAGRDASEMASRDPALSHCLRSG
jgi:hypothetical protein